MSRISRPPWRITLSALPLLALLLALAIAPALAQEEANGNYYTIKYDQYGNKLWHATYDGGGWDYAYGVALDSEGNVIVTGASEIWHDYDEDGDAVGTGDGSKTVFNLEHSPIIPQSEKIYLDGEVTTDYEIDYASGAVTFTAAPGEGVVITADYDYQELNYDCWTTKYDSLGNEVWEQPIIYDNGDRDEAYGVAVDSENNIIITSRSNRWHVYHEDSEAVGTGNGSTTVFNLKHSPVIPQSEKIYLDGEVTTDYQINRTSGAVTFTAAPGEGVAVRADYDYEALNYDYLTIKYSPEGNQLWPQPVIYDGGDADGANSMAVDSQDNIIITGYSTISHIYHKDDEVVGTGNGSKTVFNLEHSPIVAESETIYLDGEVTTDYQINRTSGAVTFTAAPGEGVAVRADYDYEETNLDYYTIKYDKDGNELWSKAFDQGRDDGALEVVVDSVNNVIVTGGCERWHDDDEDGKEDDEEVNSDYCTIKYHQDGNEVEEVWDEPLFYDSGHADTPYGIAVDSQDNIIVTGSYSTLPEAKPGTVPLPVWHGYTTIKYNPDGSELWPQPAIYDGDGQEVAYDVTVDSQDNVIVTGKVSGQTWDYYTIKYDRDRRELWNQTYDGGQWDSALDAAVDSADNIIVTGSSQAPSGGDGNIPAEGGGLPTGAIVGIAMGGCAAVGLAYYYLVYQRERLLPRAERRRRAAKKRKKAA